MTSQQAKVEKAIAYQQSEELKRTAQQERAMAHMEASRKRLENKALLGQQKAGLAGSGFVLDDAQSAKIVGESVAQATLAEQLIVAQGDQKARNYEAEARNTLWEGKQKSRLTRASGMVNLVKDGASWFNSYGSQFTNGTG